eukprot:CAMPEP_0176000340 /NCGR_PEP_ID=MMETSP0108-20121206/57770_1 /TAXON_ID=195067 ORGANISM="Goniomonas pacifica, Strain CCMP1869" /NCGR_SAMPLE_ID=MMETSP0108 /ASSEMBLY_ACC=CAM_ASM_000204 /LENGTH=111 /DNA_ID=CAMNT_0017332837 /DNA_START=187 /DNA_END=522 /DNA_ORIENTATION=-
MGLQNFPNAEEHVGQKHKEVGGQQDHRQDKCGEVHERGFNWVRVCGGNRNWSRKNMMLFVNIPVDPGPRVASPVCPIEVGVRLVALAKNQTWLTKVSSMRASLVATCPVEL